MFGLLAGYVLGKAIEIILKKVFYRIVNND